MTEAIGSFLFIFIFLYFWCDLSLLKSSFGIFGRPEFDFVLLSAMLFLSGEPILKLFLYSTLKDGVSNSLIGSKRASSTMVSSSSSCSNYSIIVLSWTSRFDICLWCNLIYIYDFGFFKLGRLSSIWSGDYGSSD